MKILKVALSLLICSLLGVLVIKLLPKSIDMDLEKIGNGRNAVVFVYDPNLVVSNQQAIELKRAREDMGEQAVFLVARVGDPQSQAFQKRFQARATELLFFNGEGVLIDRDIAVLGAEALSVRLKANTILLDPGQEDEDHD